jgi:hypothetical protein
MIREPRRRAQLSANDMPDFDIDQFLASKAAHPDPSTPAPSAAPTSKEAPFDVDSFLADHHEKLAADKSYDPVASYSANPSTETLAQAREVFKKRAAQPIDWTKAATDFAKGALPAVGGGIASMVRGAGGAAANIFTADLNPNASQANQARAQRENAAALQSGALHGGDFATGTWRNVQRLFGKTDRTLSDSEIEERIKNDAARQMVEQELAKGEVIDAPGFGRVANLPSPDELAAKGSPIRPERIKDESFIGDPTTFAAEGAGHLAGPLISRAITAPVLKGASKILAGVGKAGEGLTAAKSAVPAALWFLHSHNPLQTGLIFSAEMAAKHLAPAGAELLGEAGAEAAGAAPPVGQSLIRKAAKGAATGAVTGAALGVPFAASAQTPEQAGQAIGGGIGIGGVLGGIGGATGAGRTERATKAAQLSAEGAQIKYGLGWEDDAHTKAMAALPPEIQQQINLYRGRFNGMTDANGIPIQIYALGGGDYSRAVAEASGSGAVDTRGFISPDGTKVVVNADLAAQPSETAKTLGHELGGHATEFLAEVAQAHDISTLQDSIRSAMYDEQGNPKPVVSRFIDRYKADLIRNGHAVEGVEKLDPRYFEKEFLAEHAAKILSGKSISDFNLPKPIADRVTDGVSQWLENQGITKPTGEKLRWGATEIKDITRQLSDLLYKQGETSEALRSQRAQGVEPSPSIARRRAELQNQLSNPLTPASTLEEVKARNDAQKELDTLNKAVNAGATFPAAGKPPVPPSAPAAPPDDTPHKMARDDAIGGMRNLFKGKGGMSKTDAEKIVDQAILQIGPSTDFSELLKAALAIHQGGQPAAPVSPPVPANAPPSSPVPAVPPVAAQDPAIKRVVATLPKPAQEPEAAPTRETLRAVAKQAGDEAEKAARQHPDYPVFKEVKKSKFSQAEREAKVAEKQAAFVKEKRERAEFEAMAQAHAASLPADTDLVRWQTDRFGRTGVYGNRVDPSDPFHQELLERAGYGTQDKARLRQFEAKFGEPIGVEYLSAPDDPKAEGGAKTKEQVRELRRRAQAESTAGERASGEAPVRRAAKSFIPLSISFNRGENSFTVKGFSPDKFLANASKVIPWLRAKGIDTYSSVGDPRLIEDLNGVSRNHAAGWRGDGSAPVVPSVLTSVTPESGYEPYVIPKDRFDTLNALIGDTSATLVNEKGEPKEGSPEDRAARAEKQVMAESNSPFLDPETGEVNRVRDLMKKEGDFTFENAKGEKFTGPKVLEEASETIRPDLVEKIGPAEEAKDEHKLRPTGVESKVIAAITGTPRADFSAAGFSPNDSPQIISTAIRQKDGTLVRGEDFNTPHDDMDAVGRRGFIVRENGAEKFVGRQYAARIARENGQGDDVNNLHSHNLHEPAQFSPDTGKPEEGGTPSERLTREAEAADVVLKTEDLKGLIRMDQATVDRIRKRIEQNTGKPAQFSPSEPLTKERLLATIRAHGTDPNSEGNETDYRDSIADYLSGGARTGRPAAKVSGGENQQSRALIQWAEKNGVLLNRRLTDFDPLSPNNKGWAEHDVFFDAPSQRWIKATKARNFGFFPKAKNGEWTLARATPSDYLDRLKGMEDLFGIESPVHAIIFDKDASGTTHPQILTSQSHIEGKDVTEQSIERRLKRDGFLKIDDETSTYYRPSDNTAISDAHSGNMTVANDGKLVGYDAIVMHPEGELKALFERDHAKAAARHPAPKTGGSFLDAARARFKEETPESKAASFSPNDDPRYKEFADDLWEARAPVKPEEPPPDAAKDIREAYSALVKERGMPNVPIADVMERAGLDIPTMALGKRWLTHLWNTGEVPQLSSGDWALSDERRRAWGVVPPGQDRPMLLMKMKSAQFSPDDKSSSSPSTRQPSRYSIMAQQRKREREEAR